MNTTPAKTSSKSGIVTAIGVLVLLLGTATGNAYVLLVMSIVALAVIGIFYRHELSRIAWMVMLVAVATAVAVAFAITKL